MAELVSIKRNVDVSPGQAAPAVFHCSQGDVGSKIILGLLNNGTAYSIPSGVTVTIEGSESNGSIFTPISATAFGSDITFYLTGEMTAVAGPAICQAVLKSGSNILGTANFTLEVESSPMGADAPPVFTDAGWTWMLNKLNTEFVPALGNETIIDAIDSKLDKNQGTANAGKYLKVGANGNVETADLDVTTDKTLSIADKAADAKAVGDELTDLKADLNEKIDIDGEHQVTPQNLEGMQYTKTTVEVEGENIFDESMLFEEGYYVNIANGKITHGINATLNTYCIPVAEDTKYRFTQARFCALAKGNTLGADAVGTLEPNLTEIETGEAVYMFLTISNTATIISVKEITETPTYTDFVLPDWLKTDTSDIEDGLETVEAEKVDKNGVWQVKPQNIEGVSVSGGNVLEDAERLYSTQAGAPTTDGYVTISNGTAFIQAADDYCSFLIPVKQNTHYTANHSIRFAVLLKNLSTEGTRPVEYSTVIGSALANISSFDTGEADHIIVSWNYTSFPIGDFIISEGNTPSADKTITLPDWWTGGSTPKVVEKPKFAKVSGDMSSGDSLVLPLVKNNLRKGERIVFEGKITSFSSLKIGQTYTASVTDGTESNIFLIDGTNISYYVNGTATPVIVPHGLTIANNTQFIWEMSSVATCKITLISGGNMFSHEFNSFVRQVVGFPFVLSVDTVLTDCKLTWTCTDLCKDIWMFGDSYFAYSENRWTYYLHQYGYDNNCLLDGFPGEGGVNGRVAFGNLLQFGTPKFAVWCLGMNDGSDSNTAPSTDWVSAKNYFLQYCTDNNITPVFGTIPTVPTINHEQKNAWIRSSGYRYIDFAKAVGAQSDGTWFSGMLSPDNVHPTEKGARALFARVLLDLPEIMVDGTN